MLSTTSWRRNVAPTGSPQASAQRVNAGADACVPRPAADEHERPLRAPRAAPRARPAPRAGRRAQRAVARRVGDVGARRQHVLGQREHDRAGAPARRHRVGAREHLGDARGVVELERPLRHRAEDGLVVELLEGLAPALRARDLADEQDQRRRVLARGVHAGRGMGRARSAGDHAEPGTAGQLAVGVGRVGGGALVAAVDDAEAVAVLVEAVEQREVGLARDAERQL